MATATAMPLTSGAVHYVSERCLIVVLM